VAGTNDRLWIGLGAVMRPVPKGQQDSARGFNPGLPIQKDLALKGRQIVFLGLFADERLAELMSSAPSGRGAFLLLPGVKTPGLVLLSLRDRPR
jgi:hypothetical protein